MQKLNHMDSRHGGESGMTLVEVAVALVLLTVPFGYMVVGTAASSRQEYDSRLRLTAMQAAESKAAEIRATPVAEIPGIWGPEGTEGPGFSIPDLNDDNGPSGRVLVVTDETLSDADIGFALGMPRDLDGDGFATNTDVTGASAAIPILVTITWGPPNNQEVFQLPVIVLP